MVEHWNAQLKQRLAALGGRYTEESIERIGASLNLASLLESKLYPTYMERLEFFDVVFYYVSNEMCCKITVVRQLPEDQPWDTRKVIFGTRCLMGLQWLRCVVV